MHTISPCDLDSVAVIRNRTCPDGLRLTIGVIARDGLPFLRDCLRSLPTQLDGVATLEIILVDSVSSDGTTDVMVEFARQRAAVRVFRMDGKSNAAATRNVVLDHAAPGAVLLVDGDIVLTPEFLWAGVEAMRAGRADAVSGGLTEIHHDAGGNPVTEEFWRLRVRQEVAEYGRWACGTILLSEAVVRSGLRYDESMRLNEDRDFTIRISYQFRVITIPISMGCHLTRSYYSSDRLKQFYKDANYRWLGVLIRKHIWSLRSGLLSRFVALFGAEKGVCFGVVLQIVLVASLLSGHVGIILLSLFIVLADFARYVWQRRLKQYLPLRVVGPWMVLGGLVRRHEVRPDYTVRQLV